MAADDRIGAPASPTPPTLASMAGVIGETAALNITDEGVGPAVSRADDDVVELASAFVAIGMGQVLVEARIAVVRPALVQPRPTAAP